MILRIYDAFFGAVFDRHGQAESITPNEIEGAYYIATIHAWHPSNIIWAGEDLEGFLTGEELVEEVNSLTKCYQKCYQK